MKGQIKEAPEAGEIVQLDSQQAENNARATQETCPKNKQAKDPEELPKRRAPRKAIIKKESATPPYFESSLTSEASDDSSHSDWSQTGSSKKKTSETSCGKRKVPTSEERLSAKKPCTVPVAEPEDASALDPETRSIDQGFTAQAHAELRATYKQLENEELKMSESRLKLFETMEQEIIQSAQKVADMEKTLEEAKREIGKFQKLNLSLRCQVSSLLDRQSDPAGLIKVSDAEIIALWEEKAFNIRQLSTQVLKVDLEDGCPELGEDPGGICELWSLCELDPESRHSRLEQWIWCSLCVDIYWGGEPVWGAALGQTFLKFLNILTQHWRNYPEQLCKVSTNAAQGLDEVFAEQPNDTHERMVKTMQQRLAPFIPDSKKEDFHRRMSVIVKQGVDLYRIFLKSRAVFKVEFPPPECEEFNEKAMNPMSVCSKRPIWEQKVDIVVTPYLRKQGTADGQHFDTSTVICKAAVVLR